MSPMGANNLYDEPDVMEEFISCYRHFTALWDSSSTDYLSKQKKEPGYQELLKILRRVNGGCSVQDVKRKINSLRCCYRREIKKIQASDNGYQPRLWWFHLMDFLKPVLNIQSPVRVKSESMDDSLDETSINDDDIFSEPFATEEDVLRIEAVGDGDGDPEPEANQEPEPESITSLAHLKSERKADDYQATFSGSSKNMPYANHAIPSPRNNSDSVGREVTTDKAGRRIRIRRRRSSDYGEIARKRRVEEIPDRDTDRDRDRDRDRYRERDRDRDRDNRGRESESENECELIGRRMATHFRHMRPDQRLYAERIISEVLVYGRMNRLSFEARFIPGGK
ncbi:serine/threonine-protein kinase fray2 isoform X2 [Drosophila rhopaloa]|uniref:Serine/threonine-protein kinase fray2 isoform X2 n=1 Tax=Drosophila rhopaloa TaxID=1041015 RepID=A0A6P4F9E7_DRORH|nr:serine/threonine-protein kinase fray2 isoform X2 [Drosophila rhopaloa]